MGGGVPSEILCSAPVNNLLPQVLETLGSSWQGAGGMNQHKVRCPQRSLRRKPHSDFWKCCYRFHTDCKAYKYLLFYL